MKITKLEHSGLAVEQGGQTLLCDPVEITEKLPEFGNIIAIVITHQHSDHFQPVVINNPEILYCPISAPWCKAFDVVEYIRKFQSKTVIPAHDAVLSNFGKDIWHAGIGGYCATIGTDFKALSVGESIAIV